MREGSASLEEKEEARSAMSACWSCRGPVQAGALFCSTCHALQPPVEIDHFRRLDLPATFDLRREDVERRYFTLQRQIHPDRFAAKSAKERLYSVQHTAALNQSFADLMDPLLRAEYLLRFKGRRVAVGEAETVADSELLLEAMALREELAEAESAASVEALAAKAEEMIGRILSTLSGAFTRDNLDTAAELVLRLRYMRKFADEAKRHLSRLGG